jgi:hypothetical protein
LEFAYIDPRRNKVDNLVYNINKELHNFEVTWCNYGSKIKKIGCVHSSDVKEKCMQRFGG